MFPAATLEKAHLYMVLLSNTLHRFHRIQIFQSSHKNSTESHNRNAAAKLCIYLTMKSHLNQCWKCCLQFQKMKWKQPKQMYQQLSLQLESQLRLQLGPQLSHQLRTQRSHRQSHQPNHRLNHQLQHRNRRRASGKDSNAQSIGNYIDYNFLMIYV